MAINKYKHHVLVVPEDDANRQLANGFLLQSSSMDHRVIYICPIANGWRKILDSLENTHIEDLIRYPLRHLVLLFDFDNKVEERTKMFHEKIPQNVLDRVYLLGTSDEPEKLRTTLGNSLEKIGKDLSTSCEHSDTELWSNPMLKHNEAELERLVKSVKPFLFPTLAQTR